MAQQNGSSISVMFAFAAVVVSLVSAVAGGAYALGAHTGDSGIHEPATVKEQRIRTMVDREVAPRLDRIEEELRHLREAVENQR